MAVRSTPLRPSEWGSAKLKVMTRRQSLEVLTGSAVAIVFGTYCAAANRVSTPVTMAQAVSLLESEAAQICISWPDYLSNAPFVEGPEDLLDFLVLFVGGHPECDAQKVACFNHFQNAESFKGVFLNRHTDTFASTGKAIAAFCRSFSCNVTAELHGVAIIAEIPNADEIKLLLRAGCDLNISKR